jgi:hypothetical protein
MKGTTPPAEVVPTVTQAAVAKHTGHMGISPFHRNYPKDDRARFDTAAYGSSGGPFPYAALP